MAGARRGPLHGIPYALKDIIETAGIRTTGHSKLRQDHVPAADAEIVTRLKAGGGVLIGKLATWEFALGGPSWDLPWPPALNPWDTERLPGGSSSGAGAAVAAGFVPGAVGTDTGGSVRGPAALCGLAGIKPTYGRVSRRGVFPNTFSMDHCGPLTRSAEDIALFLQVIAGYDPTDPGSEDVPVPDYAAGLNGGVRGLRIGVAEDWYRGAPHPDVAPAIDAAVEVLRGLGATGRAGAAVEPARLHRLQDDDLQRRAVFDPRARSAHKAAGFRPHPAQPRAAGRADPRRGLHGGIALAGRTGARAGGGVPPRRCDRHGRRRSTSPTAPTRTSSTGSSPRPASRCRSASPACRRMTIPCGFSRAEGLPLSLQIAAAPFAEALVLRIAHAYQQATDWHRRHPTLA